MTRLYRQLLLKLAHWLQGSSPPAPCIEPLGHFTRPEDSCLCKGSIQKTTREDEQTERVGEVRSSPRRRGSTAGRKGANSVPGVLGINPPPPWS